MLGTQSQHYLTDFPPQWGKWGSYVGHGGSVYGFNSVQVRRKQGGRKGGEKRRREEGKRRGGKAEIIMFTLSWVCCSVVL
jgi:hypothetical protein